MPEGSRETRRGSAPSRNGAERQRRTALAAGDRAADGARPTRPRCRARAGRRRPPGPGARAQGRPRRARPRLHPRVAARPVAAGQPLVPRRGARPRAHPRRGAGAAGGQPLRRQPHARHRRVHAGLQHLLRRRAALLPAGPQPGALDARAWASCASTARSRPRPRTPTRRSSCGAALLVYPGGDYEVHRPSWERAKVDFGGRKGFIRLALEKDVPIVPVVSIGGQETALFLSRGEWLAKLLRLDRMFRLKVLPISLAHPVGAQRRRHARPRPGAGEDHDPGAARRSTCASATATTPTSTGLRRRDRRDAGHAHGAPGRAQAAGDSARATMRIEEQITVDAPARAVWELLADPADMPRFMPGDHALRRAGGDGPDAPRPAGRALPDAHARRARPTSAA